MSAPGDEGLQPERTDLAWRRTALALAVAALLSIRVLPPVLGGWTVATGLAGAALAAVIGVLARRRAVRATAAFRSGAALPGGALPAATAALTAAGAALGLLAVLVGLLR